MIAVAFLGILNLLLWWALMGIGQFVYDYQTLITGFMAVGAAYVAVQPVYRQLSLMRTQSALMQTQSNSVLQQMLLQRQQELEQAIAATEKQVAEKLSDLAREYPWYEEEEDIRLTETQAHHYEQHISSAAFWLRRRYRWRDSPIVEAQKIALLSTIDILIRKLGEIYLTSSMQQHDEDHSIDDVEWARLELRGEEAKSEIYPALVVTQKGLTAFVDANRQELSAIDIQLRKLDQALITAQS